MPIVPAHPGNKPKQQGGSAAPAAMKSFIQRHSMTEYLIISKEPFTPARGWDKRRIEDIEPATWKAIAGYTREGYHVIRASHADRNKKEWILTLQRFATLIKDGEPYAGYLEEVAISVLHGKLKVLRRQPVERFLCSE